MIIRSDEFARIPGLTAATLTESSDASASVLSLEFAGEGPDWVKYMEPVTILHRGRVLFHGKITSLPRSNNAGEVSTSVTVSDFRWLMDHSTLGAQLAELKAAAVDESVPVSLRDAATTTMSGWGYLEQSSLMAAPGWTVDADGTPLEEAEIGVDASKGNRDTVGAVATKDRALSVGYTLQRMKEANPGCFYKADYIAGRLEVWHYKALPELTIDTAQARVVEAGSIDPRYEDAVTGVALVVEYEEQYGNISGNKMKLHRVRLLPEDISLEDIGVRVFTASAPDKQRAKEQEKHVMRQLEGWYEAASRLQWTGSVQLLMEYVEPTPLATKVNLTGPGVIKSWETMNAEVSAVEWDFMAGVVTLTLGSDLAEPEIGELEWPESEEESTEEDSSEEESTTEEESTEEESTEEESTAEEYTEGSGSGSDDWSGTDDWSESQETESANSTEEPAEETTYHGCCNCGERWKEIERRLKIIEERITIIEHTGGSCECNCQCGDLLPKILAAIDAAVAGVQVQASLTQLQEITQTGELKVTGSVTANSKGGSSQVDAHY